jgi:hypothetical protein
MADGERKIVTLDDIERRHMAEHIGPYYEWIRHVVTLATGSLTVLVSLQGHYVPKLPVYPLLLVSAWASLAAAILFGLWALTNSYRTRIRMAQDIRDRRQKYGDAVTARQVSHGIAGEETPATHRWCVRLMTACFGVGLIALCGFSAANLLR